MIGIAIGICVSPTTSDAGPGGYDCGVNGKADQAHGRCICPPGSMSSTRFDPHTEVTNNVCVAAPVRRVLAPPELVEPAHGADGVDATTEFVVKAPPGADAVEVEICGDSRCSEAPIQVFEKPASPTGVRFRIENLKSGAVLYWRVRGRAGSQLRGPAAMRSFKVADAQPAQAVGDALDHDLSLARLTRSATAHRDLALRLFQAQRCADVLVIVGLPRDPDTAVEQQLDQLARDCARPQTDVDTRPVDPAERDEPEPPSAQAPPPPIVPSASPSTPPLSTPSVADLPPSSSQFTTRRKVAVAVAAAGALALTAGVVLEVYAKRKQHDAYALCPDLDTGCDGADRANQLIRDGHDLGIDAGVTLGVGAAAAITAGVLWFTGTAQPHRVAVIPAASPRAFVVAAIASF